MLHMNCVSVVSGEHWSVDEEHLNFTGDPILFQRVYDTLYGYGLPVVCVCGFVGNLLNLIILGGRGAPRYRRRSEQSVNKGLIALALADLFFCISAFPSTFLPSDNIFRSSGTFLTHYNLYCAAIINIFIMTSTWLTVIMACERYLAICHPLKSRNIITLRRTTMAIVLAIVFSALFNMPVFWRYRLVQWRCPDADKNHSTWHAWTIQLEVIWNDETFDHVYRAGWAILGNLLPLLLLSLCNVALMRQIHRSYAMRARNNVHRGAGMSWRGKGTLASSTAAADSETSLRITVTLVAIVVMFLVLVAPSEVLKHTAMLIGSDLTLNYTYRTVEVVTNFMQTVNFSANFILYCIINPSFRRSMRRTFCFRSTSLETVETHLTARSMRTGSGRSCPSTPRRQSSIVQLEWRD